MGQHSSCSPANSFRLSARAPRLKRSPLGGFSNAHLNWQGRRAAAFGCTLRPANPRTNLPRRATPQRPDDPTRAGRATDRRAPRHATDSIGQGHLVCPAYAPDTGTHEGPRVRAGGDKRRKCCRLWTEVRDDKNRKALEPRLNHPTCPVQLVRSRFSCVSRRVEAPLAK